MARNFLYKNLPNIVSVLGVVPLCLLFAPGEAKLLPALIVYNNFMDDLDGTLARTLNLRSEFGATIDNLCDAVATTLLAMAVGAFYGRVALVASAFASASVLIRMTGRMVPGAKGGGGSPTNELMRHLLFLMLLERAFGAHVSGFVVVTMVMHAASMVSPFPMPQLLRTKATSVRSIALVNVALLVAFFVPFAILPIAIAFWATYLYAFFVGIVGYRRRNGAGD